MTTKVCITPWTLAEVRGGGSLMSLLVGSLSPESRVFCKNIGEEGLIFFDRPKVTFLSATISSEMKISEPTSGQYLQLVTCMIRVTKKHQKLCLCCSSHQTQKFGYGLF